MKRLNDLRRRPGTARWLWPVCIVAFVMFTCHQLRARRVYEVAKPTENIRSSPEGLRLGVLEKGTEIDEIGRDGQWVKFELVAWVWGPSLEGFEEDEARLDRPAKARDGASDAEAKAQSSAARQPRQALNVHLEQVRDLVNADFGRFYGLSHNAEAGEVTVRFRVPEIGEEILWQRQMRAQARIDVILAPDVEYARVRVETNRPDGTGSVGQYVAIADTATIRGLGEGDLDAWLEAAQRSDDGGQTWK